MKNVVLYIGNQKMGGNMRHKIKKIVISYILSICCILSFTIGMEVTNIMYLRNIFLQRNHQRLQKVVHISVM